MKLRFRLILVVGVLMITGSCARHSQTVLELENYQPPPLYQTTGQVPPSRKPSDPGRPDKAFEAQKQKLADMKTKWIQKLSHGPDTPQSPVASPNQIDNPAAEKILSGDFSLKDLEHLVSSRNPMIKSAEKDLQASFEAYDQASILNDIIRSYSAFNASIMTGVGNMDDMESIYNTFPFPGILSLKGAIVHQGVRLAQKDLEIARRTAMTEAGKNYWELVYNGQAKKITRQTLALLEKLESFVTSAYETGQSGIPELTRIKIQREKTKQDLTTIFEQGQSIRNNLKALLLLPMEAKIGTPAGFDGNQRVPPLAALINAALEHRQELEKTRIMISRMELMIEMAETQIYPGFTLNLALTPNRAVNQAGTLKKEDPFAVTVPASMGEGLPIRPWTGLLDAYLRETRHQLSALKEALKGREAGTMAAVSAAWVEADRAKREFELYHDRIDSLSEINFTVSSSAYESGSVSFSETLAAALLKFETRLMAERRRADLGISLTGLYETVGISEGF